MATGAASLKAIPSCVLLVVERVTGCCVGLSILLVLLPFLPLYVANKTTNVALS